MPTLDSKTYFQEMAEATKFRNILVKVSQRAESGCYYGSNKHDFETALKDIQKILDEANLKK